MVVKRSVAFRFDLLAAAQQPRRILRDKEVNPDGYKIEVLQRSRQYV